ncbi:toxin-antitoxin system HicB family antitoxin [bacterium]|nr:toxin-antitoxin system HicB family antitoxin [bacterium]
MQKPSGKFVLRLDPMLHALLQKWAAQQNLSLNQLCLERVLGAGLGRNHPEFQSTLLKALYAAMRIHGEDLEGVILFGSWARGEQREGSDMDLLVVLREGGSIKRDLYRKWDALEATCVEPSIVALPASKNVPSSLWAEVSIEGILLFERNQKVRNYLVKVREAIANGVLRRERTHGQNYWVHDTKGV